VYGTAVMTDFVSPGMRLSQRARRARGMESFFIWVDVDFFGAESPLDPFDSGPKYFNYFASHPQAIERGKLVLLHRSYDMTDAGWASKGIDQQEDKKGSRKNPEENANSFFFKEECSHQGTGDHQCQDETPGGPAVCSPGDDGLDIGEVKAFVILREAIVIYTEDMVIGLVERASGE